MKYFCNKVISEKEKQVHQFSLLKHLLIYDTKKDSKQSATKCFNITKNKFISQQGQTFHRSKEIDETRKERQTN